MRPWEAGERGVSHPLSFLIGIFSPVRFREEGPLQVMIPPLSILGGETIFFLISFMSTSFKDALS